MKNVDHFYYTIYFKVPKIVRPNSNHFFITTVPNIREPQSVALNNSSDIHFKDFITIYKKCTAWPNSVLVNDTTWPSDNPLRFRKKSFKTNVWYNYDNW